MSKRRPTPPSFITPPSFKIIGTDFKISGTELSIDDGEYGLPEQSESQPESQPEKPAKTRKKPAKSRKSVKYTLTVVALDRLRDERPNEYSDGFSEARPNIVESQIKPIWRDVVKAAGHGPDKYTAPKQRMISRAMKNYIVRDHD
jgi:hypothetical protein